MISNSFYNNFPQHLQSFSSNDLYSLKHSAILPYCKNICEFDENPIMHLFLENATKESKNTVKVSCYIN